MISGLAKMLSFQLIKKLHRSYYILLYKIWKNIYPRERLTRFERKAFLKHKAYLKHKRDIKSLDYRIVSLFLSIYLFIFILRKQFLISHSQTEINRIQTTLQKNHYPNTHLKP